ncbi:MAG: HDOD domain-containing protein [Fibromonadaceae bacterium]|jgi:putative nucleotidyltransferase with HDIG domain|nr:HDOD domain-containing protein [Fibromonadaceae bacterium]
MGELPTLPSVFFTINKMLSDPRTSAVEVGLAISSDQVITTKILRLVNSAFYGFSGRVNTISHAISILGFSSTKNIVLATSVLSSLKLKNPIEGFNLAAFWKHSAAVGAISKLVAAETHPQKQEEAFTAGLLHDIGKLILAICAPEEFAQCLNLAISKNCLFIDVEREVLGITHTEIVKWINEKWNLPEEIVNVITNHHNKIYASAGEHAKLIAVVQIADVLARGLQYGHPCDNSLPILGNNVLDILGLTPQKLDSILLASHEALQNSMVFVSAD